MILWVWNSLNDNLILTKLDHIELKGFASNIAYDFWKSVTEKMRHFGIIFINTFTIHLAHWHLRGSFKALVWGRGCFYYFWK